MCTDRYAQSHQRSLYHISSKSLHRYRGVESSSSIAGVLCGTSWTCFMEKQCWHPQSQPGKKRSRSKSKKVEELHFWFTNLFSILDHRHPITTWRANTVKTASDNVYISPVSPTTYPRGTLTSIEHLLVNSNDVIMGGFNAHHPLWHSNRFTGTRGREIADQVSHLDFCVLNDPHAHKNRRWHHQLTRHHNRAPDLLPSTNWSTSPSLSSDYLPIIIELQDQIRKSQVMNRTSETSPKPNGMASRLI